MYVCVRVCLCVCVRTWHYICVSSPAVSAVSINTSPPPSESWVINFNLSQKSSTMTLDWPLNFPPLAHTPQLFAQLFACAANHFLCHSFHLISLFHRFIFLLCTPPVVFSECDSAGIKCLAFGSVLHRLCSVHHPLWMNPTAEMSSLVMTSAFGEEMRAVEFIEQLW